MKPKERKPETIVRELRNELRIANVARRIAEQRAIDVGNDKYNLMGRLTSVTEQATQDIAEWKCRCDSLIEALRK